MDPTLSGAGASSPSRGVHPRRALRDLLIAPGLNTDDLPETEEVIKNARDLLNDELIGNALDSQFDRF